MPGPGSRRDAGAHAAVAPPEPLSAARWLTAAPPLVNKATRGSDPRAGVFKLSSSHGLSLSVHTWSLTWSLGQGDHREGPPQVVTCLMWRSCHF